MLSSRKEKEMKKTYAGKIKNVSSQRVDSLFEQGKGKPSKKTKGGDLRTGKGGK